jgi:hypothetical protein
MSKIKISFSIKFGPFLARIQIAISRTWNGEIACNLADTFVDTSSLWLPNIT